MWALSKAYEISQFTWCVWIPSATARIVFRHAALLYSIDLCLATGECLLMFSNTAPARPRFSQNDGRVHFTHECEKGWWGCRSPRLNGIKYHVEGCSPTAGSVIVVQLLGVLSISLWSGWVRQGTHSYMLWSTWLRGRALAERDRMYTSGRLRQWYNLFSVT